MTAAREMEVADIANSEIDLSMRGYGPFQAAGPEIAAASFCRCMRTWWPICARYGWNSYPDAGGRRLLGDIVGNGLRGFSKLKTKVAETGRDGLALEHDLRRTARTGMARLGVSSSHAEAALNHVSGRSALERTYDRHDYSPEVIEALALWQAHVAKLVAQSPD